MVANAEERSAQISCVAHLTAEYAGLCFKGFAYVCTSHRAGQYTRSKDRNFEEVEVGVQEMRFVTAIIDYRFRPCCFLPTKGECQILGQ